MSGKKDKRFFKRNQRGGYVECRIYLVTEQEEKERNRLSGNGFAGSEEGARSETKK